MMEWSRDFLLCPEFMTSPPPPPGLLPRAPEMLRGHFGVGQQQRATTPHITLWHIKGATRISEWLLPFCHLGANQVGLAGRGSHDLYMLEHYGFQAYPGKNRNAWAPPCQQIPQKPHVHKSSGKVPKLCA